jgi:hypothetical protein
MRAVWHGVPRDMIGDTLFPLANLGTWTRRCRSPSEPSTPGVSRYSTTGWLYLIAVSWTRSTARRSTRWPPWAGRRLLRRRINTDSQDPDLPVSLTGFLRLRATAAGNGRSRAW